MPLPTGFGNQENPAVSTNSLSYTTVYTIPVTNFKPNTNYILLLQWQCYNSTTGIPGSARYNTKAVFNGSTLPNGEFTGSLSNAVSTPAPYLNHMVMTRISQPSTLQPITIEARVTDASYPITTDYIRWIAIDESSMDPNDYAFNESTTPVNLTSSYSSYITSTPNEVTSEDWIFFCCSRVELINPSYGSNTAYVVSLDVGGISVAESTQHSFNDTQVTRSLFMMAPRTSSQLAVVGRSVAFKSRIVTGFAPGDNVLSCTGSVLSLRRQAFLGYQNVANISLNPVANLVIPPGNWNVWHIGSNLNVIDPPAITDGVSLSSLPEGTYAPSLGASSLPQGYDWRIDTLSGGLHTFEYNDLDMFGRASHAVLQFEVSIPIFTIEHSTDSLLFDYKQKHNTNSLLLGTILLTNTTNSFVVNRYENTHTSNSYLSELKVLGHTSSSSICTVRNINHTTSSFLEDITINGTSSFYVGISMSTNGIVSGVANKPDVNCINRRMLYNYGWDPSPEQTRNYNKCNTKR